jgi:tRNA G10  N-methylase Trm11
MKAKRLAILGRQPELALAELESLLGPGKIRTLGSHAALLDDEVPFTRLGGTIKLADILEQDVKSKGSILQDISKLALPHILATQQQRDISKLQFGISVYGKRCNPRDINRIGLDIKRRIRSKNMSVRLIPNQHQDLNAAQVIHNKLLGARGFELVVFYANDRVTLARTTNVQNINAYTFRDRNKPVRDPLVGMLPPKLAQILINLGSPNLSNSLLDPFCGTGTVLIEAMAMGFEHVYGTDIAPAMVEAAQQNTEWFAKSSAHPAGAPQINLELADACSYEWKPPIEAVAAETYLGPPLRFMPSAAELDLIISDIDDIHRRFLQNIAPQLAQGSRLALAVPAWRQHNRFIDLPVLDDLEKLGYNPTRFEHVKEGLIYHRPEQLVARRVTVLQRK